MSEPNSGIKMCLDTKRHNAWKQQKLNFPQRTQKMEIRSTAGYVYVWFKRTQTVETMKVISYWFLVAYTIFTPNFQSGICYNLGMGNNQFYFMLS